MAGDVAGQLFYFKETRQQITARRGAARGSGVSSDEFRAENMRFNVWAAYRKNMGNETLSALRGAPLLDSKSSERELQAPGDVVPTCYVRVVAWEGLGFSHQRAHSEHPSSRS